MAKKTKDQTELPVDYSVLSKTEREALTQTAQQSVDEAVKQKASDAYFAKETERLRRKHIPSEQYVRIVIDSAPYVPYFMLDGVQFFNGYEYQVVRSQAAVLTEQMQRSWQHQDEVDGRSRFAPYRRAQGMKIGLQDAGTSTPGTAPGGAIHADMEI